MIKNNKKLAQWQYKEKLYPYNNKNKFDLNPNPYWKIIKYAVLNELYPQNNKEVKG